MFTAIGSGMPYLHIFVEEIVALLGAMADKWVSGVLESLKRQEKNASENDVC